MSGSDETGAIQKPAVGRSRVRAFLLALAALGAALAVPARGADSAVCADCVRATMERLAGDPLRGRRCGSRDEHAAAQYLAESLKRLGVAGALPDGGYLQPVEIRNPTYGALPTLDLTSGEKALRLTQGEEMVASGAPPVLDAPLVRAGTPDMPPEAVRDRVVIYDSSGASPVSARAASLAFFRAGAAAVIVPATPTQLGGWADLAFEPPGRPEVIGGAPGPSLTTVIFVRPEVMPRLAAFAQGQAHLVAPRGPPVVRTTYNVLAIRHGSAPDSDAHAILLSAHYDHLGVRGTQIFHGANDDASGTSAVMEFARLFGRGPSHRRTVIFAMFGCEEEGLLGASYFLSHTPVPTADIAANLEFEMIGVDDPNHPGALMLTGFNRSNLGATLQAHGAKIGPDPYPEQHVFERSDNYQLARRGVVAHTISAWPLPPTYHQATDDLAHVDLAFMARVIGSLVQPVQWLMDSDFQPEWDPGQKP